MTTLHVSNPSHNSSNSIASSSSTAILFASTYTAHAHFIADFDHDEVFTDAMQSPRASISSLAGSVASSSTSTVTAEPDNESQENLPALVTLLDNHSLSNLSHSEGSRSRSTSLRQHGTTQNVMKSGLEEVVFAGRISRPTTPTSRHAGPVFNSDDVASTYTTPKRATFSTVAAAPQPHIDFLHCEQITIVPNANVALLVGAPTSPERRKIIVSSVILSIASSYFRALLMPDRFTEGISFQIHKQIELHLFDDDPMAVTTVCNMLHLQSQNIPKTLSGDELAEIAIVLDKYDCTDAVWAWTRFWMAEDSVRKELEEEGSTVQMEEAVPSQSNINGLLSKEKHVLSKWVFIAWVFRDEKVFGMCANALSWKMCAGDQDDDDYFQRLPESLQRDLIATRSKCIDDLHECTQTFLDKFVDPICGVGTQHLYYYGKHLPRDCDARVLGTTLKSLREAELYPPSKIAKWETTASELVGDLKAVGRSIFGANEHHHEITPGQMFLDALDVGMKKFVMENYLRR